MILYRGTTQKTDQVIDPKRMLDSNCQEGPGIYFSDNIAAASIYGDNVVVAELPDSTIFIDSRESVADAISKDSFLRMVSILTSSAEGSSVFSDILADYGIEAAIDEPCVPVYMIYDFYELVKEEQIRNFAIEMSERFGVEAFFKAFGGNVFPNKRNLGDVPAVGFKNDEIGFYAIVSTRDNNIRFSHLENAEPELLEKIKKQSEKSLSGEDMKKVLSLLATVSPEKKIDSAISDKESFVIGSSEAVKPH